MVYKLVSKACALPLLVLLVVCPVQSFTSPPLSTQASARARTCKRVFLITFLAD